MTGFGSGGVSVRDRYTANRSRVLPAPRRVRVWVAAATIPPLEAAIRTQLAAPERPWSWMESSAGGSSGGPVRSPFGHRTRRTDVVGWARDAKRTLSTGPP